MSTGLRLKRVYASIPGAASNGVRTGINTIKGLTRVRLTKKRKGLPENRGRDPKAWRVE